MDYIRAKFHVSWKIHFLKNEQTIPVVLRTIQMHQKQQFIFQDFQVKKISLWNQMIKWIFDPVETVDWISLASMRIQYKFQPWSVCKARWFQIGCRGIQ
jgi:hypothetical protein